MSSSLATRVPAGFMVGIGVVLMFACTSSDHEEDDTQFREDVIWCEEAVAHLDECCGTAFDPHQVACRHFYSKDTGCNQTTIQRTDPAYTTEESKCVRDQSCETIRANKICERALAAGSARTTNYSVDTTSSSSSSGILPGPPSSSTSTTSSGGSSASGPICP